MAEKSIEKYLWSSVVLFITYLFLGSYFVSKNLLDIIYLIILYSFIILVSIIKKKGSLSNSVGGTKN